MLIEDTGWYPQIIGMGEGESDSLFGRLARLYIYGHSYYVFLRTGEPDPGAEPPAPPPPPPSEPESTPGPGPEPVPESAPEPEQQADGS